MHIENLSTNAEDKLVAFACLCLEVCDLLPDTKACSNLEFQLSKSATACALLYTEAKAAESKVDFIRKMKIALKELLGLKIILRIINQRPLVKKEKIDSSLAEATKLISFLNKSIEAVQEKRTIRSKKR